MRLPRHPWFFLIAFSLPLPFLFLKQLAPGDALWLQRVWDTGHVALFAIWMIIAVRLLPVPLNTVFVLARAFGLFAAAVSIEYIQLHTGRQFSVLDMYLDACGIALGARLAVPALRNLPEKLRGCLDLLLIVLLASGLRDAGMYLLDRIYREAQFPVLWSAAQPFPLLRFDNNERYTIINDDSTGNAPSLPVDFTTAEYSTVELLEVASDWRSYSTLNIDVTNPGPVAFDITCRVHDEAHFTRGGSFEDRFNRTFTLQPGSNSLTIASADIESAPLNRKMQMDSIQSIACFTIKLRQPRKAFFRAIWLDRQTPDANP